MSYDHDILCEFVMDFLMKTGAYPTVRQCARKLRWTQEGVAQVAEGDPDSRMDLTSFGADDPIGDHFVEIPDIAAALAGVVKKGEKKE